jgi:outer membrane protein assembly factor BamB
MVVFGGGNGALTSGGDGNLYALDAGTGERAWCVPTGGSVLGAFAYADGLFVGTVVDPRVQLGNGSAIVALDPDTGEEQWRTYVGGSAGDLLIEDETVFVSAGGNLTALDLETGEIRWHVAPGDRDDDSIVSAAVADGVVYLNYYGGLDQPKRIYALDAESGDELWTYDDIAEDQYINGGPTVADGLVYIGLNDGALYALDADDGEDIWRFQPDIEAWDGIEEGGMSFNEPAVVDGVVFVGTGVDFDEVEGDTYLFAIDAETGEERWRYEVGDPVRMQPAIADGVAYAGDLTGQVHAVDTETGEALWTFALDGELGPDSPVVVDGVLFITDRDGSLYAIAGEDR